MKRIEKVGEVAVRTITFPIRVFIGLYNCVNKNMPETLDFPFEIKKKGEKTDANTIEGRSEEIRL